MSSDGGAERVLPTAAFVERAGRRGEASARRLAGIRARAWVVTVWGAVFLWAIALFLVIRDRYIEFRYAKYDLGNMVQAVWSTAHGRPLEVTNGVTGEQMVRLGGHVDPILALLAPLWIVAPSALTLVAVQVFAVALGAIAVFWLGRRHLGSEAGAALLALAYLAYPWTAWATVDVFHPVVLAIPLFLFCVWFLDTDRLVPFAICAVLAAATGELMGFVVAALGIWYALARGRRVTGLAIAVAGSCWSLFALKVVVPAFSGGSSMFFGAYRHVGGSPWGLVRTTFTDPAAVADALGQGHNVFYLLLLSAPLGGLFLLAPGLASVALPQLAANVLADRSHTTDPHVRYVAGILPFLFAALVLGLARLSPSARRRGIALVLTLSLATTIAVGPWPATIFGASSWDRLDPRATTPRHVLALQRAVALVPRDAPVSATNQAGSHLSARRYIYSAPVVGGATWLVLDSTDTWAPYAFGGRFEPNALRRLRDRVSRSSAWERVFAQDGVVVYRRVPSG